MFGNSFRFHSNLAFKRHAKSFLHYYRDLLLNWKRYFWQKTEATSYILSQNLWFNQCIEVDKEPVHLANFSGKNKNTVSKTYDSNNSFINWNIIKKRYKLQEETYFQLICVIPRSWKDIIKENTKNVDNLLTHNHHIIRGSRTSTVDKYPDNYTPILLRQ